MSTSAPIIVNEKSTKGGQLTTPDQLHWCYSQVRELSSFVTLSYKLWQILGIILLRILFIKRYIIQQRTWRKVTLIICCRIIDLIYRQKSTSNDVAFILIEKRMDSFLISTCLRLRHQSRQHLKVIINNKFIYI